MNGVERGTGQVIKGSSVVIENVLLLQLFRQASRIPSCRVQDPWIDLDDFIDSLVYIMVPNQVEDDDMGGDWRPKGIPVEVKVPVAYGTVRYGRWVCKVIMPRGVSYQDLT